MIGRPLPMRGYSWRVMFMLRSTANSESKRAKTMRYGELLAHGPSHLRPANPKRNRPPERRVEFIGGGNAGRRWGSARPTAIRLSETVSGIHVLDHQLFSSNAEIRLSNRRMLRT